MSATSALYLTPRRWPTQPTQQRLALQIQQDVADLCRLSLGQLRGDSHMSGIVVPRQAAIWLVRRHTSLSLAQIGRAFLRHHTTVLYALRSFRTRLAWDAEAQALIAIVESSIPPASAGNDWNNRQALNLRKWN